MGLYRSVAGSIRVKVTSADLGNFLLRMRMAGISAEQMETPDTLSAAFSVRRSDYQKLKILAERGGERLERIGYRGLFWVICGLFFRPVLIAGIGLLIFLSIYLPGKILFIRVEGNTSVPDNRILEAASESGLSFGVSRRGVRNEQIKNSMLERIPQLQWVGVNTDGCNAVITVRERAQKEQMQCFPGISSMVASGDGIVLSVTAERGSAVCRVGQAVTKGEVLISGYMDKGLVISGMDAKGEVIALTSREQTVITPGIWRERAGYEQQHEKFSLLIGKKRINFCKGSGIYGGTCVKMFKKYVLTLPGGFELPVTLIRETVTDAKVREAEISKETAGDLMIRFASRYLKEQMIAGTITDQNLVLEQKDGCYRLTGRYSCTEMIGRLQEEMIGEYHGKSNGADRQRGSGG